jgi:hypothetical protein
LLQLEQLKDNVFLLQQLEFIVEVKPSFISPLSKHDPINKIDLLEK